MMKLKGHLLFLMALLLVLIWQLASWMERPVLGIESEIIPVARLLASRQQSIEPNLPTALRFDIAYFNVSGMRLRDAPSRLVAPKACTYLISGNFSWTQPFSGRSYLYFAVNGRERIAIVEGLEDMNLTTLYPLRGGDYVEMFAYYTGAGPMAVRSIPDHSPSFSMACVAPYLEGAAAPVTRGSRNNPYLADEYLAFADGLVKVTLVVVDGSELLDRLTAPTTYTAYPGFSWALVEAELICGEGKDLCAGSELTFCLVDSDGWERCEDHLGPLVDNRQVGSENGEAVRLWQGLAFPIGGEVVAVKVTWAGHSLYQWPTFAEG